jgi:hypothetical protein
LHLIDPVVFNTLRQFRAGIYQRFGSRPDAVDLLDASSVIPSSLQFPNIRPDPAH